MSDKQVHVIGAGIIGLTTAYELAIRGYQVTVFEENRYNAHRCSYANGGQISVSNSEVWNTWANVKRALKWMFKKDAPFYIHPSFQYDKIKWLLQFLFETIKGTYARNTADTIKMGLRSRKLYENIIRDENIEFDKTNCGILHFYKDREYFNSANATAELYEYNGCEWQIIYGDNLVKYDPALKDINNLLGGGWTPADWTGDIYKFCSALSSVLKSKYGVIFNNNTKIDTLVNTNITTVVCAGIGSKSIAKTIGDNLSIYPVKGYSITINNCDPNVIPKVSLLDDQAKIATSTLGNRFRVVGTAELAGENYDITRSRIEPLLNWVYENFPDLDCNDYSQWVCLRPMTPNMIPIVKQSNRNKNVFYNTGHGHLGWTLAPATAEKIVNLIEEL